MMTVRAMMVPSVTCLVLVASSALLPMSTLAHVCDSLNAEDVVCDPDDQGDHYFICNGQGQNPQRMSCPVGLKFDNVLKVCNWALDGYECSAGDQSSSTTSTTTTTTPTTTTTTSAHSSTTTPTTTTTTTTTSVEPTSMTTKSKSGAKINPCAVAAVNNGFICDPETSGTSYIQCANGVAYKYMCPAGTYFNKAAKYCDWPDNIAEMCVAGGSKTTTTTAGTGSTTTGTTTTTSTTTTAPLPSGPCNAGNCKLPDCRCLGIDIPGDIPKEKVPQMILLTFDDAITQDNYQRFYEKLFPENAQEALKNPNGCRTAATFFVSGQNTNMSLVRKLWDRGNEMASHSKTHTHTNTWGGKDGWTWEMQGMRENLTSALSSNDSEVAGMRVPFLEMGKETQFHMMRDSGISYDSTMYGGALREDHVGTPYWPFTLDHPPDHSVCDHYNCPKASHPGIWEVPIIRQYNLQGDACSMTDACSVPYNAGDVKEFLRRNFQRHNTTNRAPFMISLHATWFNSLSRLHGLQAFLNMTNADDSVWQVTLTQMLDWVRDPKPIERVTELDTWKACPPVRGSRP